LGKLFVRLSVSSFVCLFDLTEARQDLGAGFLVARTWLWSYGCSGGAVSLTV